jgi:hypothetical protein
MVLKCANPECSSQFDYREGQLIRAPRRRTAGDVDKSVEIKHFWLCGRCATLYVLEYRKGQGVIITPQPLGHNSRAAARVVAA